MYSLQGTSKMYNIISQFIPGDTPGDPELGGCRPLPRSFFRRLAPTVLISGPIGLEQAVRVVAFMVRYIRLYKAVGAVAETLRK
jgi:hypothetical protein